MYYRSYKQKVKGLKVGGVKLLCSICKNLLERISIELIWSEELTKCYQVIAVCSISVDARIGGLVLLVLLGLLIEAG